MILNLRKEIKALKQRRLLFEIIRLSEIVHFVISGQLVCYSETRLSFNMSLLFERMLQLSRISVFRNYEWLGWEGRRPVRVLVEFTD